MSWEKVKIPEVLFFQEGPGVRNSQFKESGIKLLNVGNINNGILNLGTTKIYISKEEAFNKYKHFLVDDGDLLIASSGIIVSNFHNKITWATRMDLPLCMNTSTIRFKSLDSSVLDIRYFSYYLQTRIFTDQLRKLITGSAQLNFGPSHLKQIFLPLPPLHIQKQIANILDKADALRKKDQQLLQKYDELSQSIFIDMFGDPVKNEKGWEVKKLGELCSDFKYGTNQKSHEDQEGGIPIIRIPNVLNSVVNYDNLKYSILSEKEFRQVKLEKGDLLFVRTNGNPAYIGRCAVFNDSLEVGYASYLIRTRVDDRDAVFPEFLQMTISFKTYRALVLKKATTTAGNYNINTAALKSLPIYIPPINLQKEFISIVQNIEQQKYLLGNNSQKDESVFQSLLQKAFTGELIHD